MPIVPLLSVIRLYSDGSPVGVISITAEERPFSSFVRSCLSSRIFQFEDTPGVS